MVGASGIVGRAVAELLINPGWTVFGLARSPTGQPGVTAIAADLQHAAQTSAALAGFTGSSAQILFTTGMTRRAGAPRSPEQSSVTVANDL